MPVKPSNDMLKRLRKLIGHSNDGELQVVDAVLTELSHLIKQIRVLAKPPCYDHIGAICSRVDILRDNQAKLDPILDWFGTILQHNHDHVDVYSFGMEYVSRLRTLHRPITELATWAARNKDQAIARDNGNDLLLPVKRIVSVLRSSGWEGLEESDLHDLSLMEHCDGGIETTLTLELEFAKPKLQQGHRRPLGY